MSGNSCESALQTAPMVSALLCGGASRGPAGTSAPLSACWGSAMLASQVGELVLADLQLVAVLEPVRLDPAAVDVGPVEGPEVVDVEAVATGHEQRVVTRNGHIVEEDLGLLAASDRHALAGHVEGLARAAAAGSDHQRGALVRDLLEVDRLEVPRLVHLVDLGGVARLLARLRLAEERAALLTVVGALGVDEAA